MKVVRYAVGSEARLGLVLPDDRIAELPGDDDLVAWLQGGKLTQSAFARPLADCKLLAPVARPSKIIAVGRNYRSHNREMSAGDGRFPNVVPSAWIKASSTLAGAFDDVVKPRATSKLDYETELAVVIGKRCRHVSEADAYSVIAGYTIASDITARDIVAIERAEGNQLLGKMFDTFCPMGPWFVTADEVPDPMNLPLVTRVNGEVRQDSNTGNMIWPIPKLVAYVSQMTLEAGDVILTGTPSGVAMGHKGDDWFLKAGDILESELGGIGAMRNRIVDAPDAPTSWDWLKST
jgi:acylpyruvate hydrolase